MITLQQIRDDLKEIRYYMSRKAVFDKSAESVGQNAIETKMGLYNSIVCNASPRLYDLYVSLYLENNTQESLSETLGYSVVHIGRLNGQLLKFLQAGLNNAQSA